MSLNQKVMIPANVFFVILSTTWWVSNKSGESMTNLDDMVSLKQKWWVHD
jgi:hypothetical protein